MRVSLCKIHAQKVSHVGLVQLVSLAACGCLMASNILAQTPATNQAQPHRHPVDPRFISAIISSINPMTKTLLLYEDDPIPNSTPGKDEEVPGPYPGQIQKVSQPTIQLFLASKAKSNGSAVIIFPGGGYSALGVAECIKLAEDFQDHGTAAFVVKYRLPSDKTMPNKSIGPLQDAQQAIRLVRSNAEEWRIDPNKVGVMGLSAGGHLASTLGTHFEKAYINNTPAVNLRPDFMILMYPVISMEGREEHYDSTYALLGEHASSELAHLFSNQTQVTKDTPPTLIITAANDHLVDPDNSIEFFEALRLHDIPVEMLLTQSGDHGLVTIPKARWEPLIFDWMSRNKWVN